MLLHMFVYTSPNSCSVSVHKTVTLWKSSVLFGWDVHDPSSLALQLVSESHILHPEDVAPDAYSSAIQSHLAASALE